MQGLEISRRFYDECVEPLMTKELPDLVPSLAVGLVGEGSECFGFDDAFSKDHDWGAGVCLWCPDELVSEIYDRVESMLGQLPSEFLGFPTRMAPERRNGRVGLMGIGEFYGRFTNQPQPPQSVEQWWAIPEHFLAVCTNGQVFSDPSGQFTAYRQSLLDYYPEDVRLKRMAARCANMAQSGQYNLLRSLKRGDNAASVMAVSRFVEAAISFLFLMNKRYVPFYKWAFRACKDLPDTAAILETLEQLAGCPWTQSGVGVEEVQQMVESVCIRCADQLRSAGLTSTSDNWLMLHSEEMQQHIEHDGLRNLPPLVG